MLRIVAVALAVRSHAQGEARKTVKKKARIPWTIACPKTGLSLAATKNAVFHLPLAIIQGPTYLCLLRKPLPDIGKSKSGSTYRAVNTGPNLH